MELDQTITCRVRQDDVTSTVDRDRGDCSHRMSSKSNRDGMRHGGTTYKIAVDGEEGV